MVDFETQVYAREGNTIVGAEVIVKSDAGDRIGSIIITDETDYNDLVARIDGLSNECVTFNANSSLAGQTIETILANLSEATNINATKLGGLQSDQYTKTGHTHNKNAITNLYNYNISISDYNPVVGSEVTVTVKVTKQNGSPVDNQNIIVTKNGAIWKKDVFTNSNGIYTAKFTPSDEGLVTFGVENQKVQLFAKHIWKTLYSNDKITLQNKGDEMRLFCTYWDNVSVTGNWKTLFTLNGSLSDYKPTGATAFVVSNYNLMFRLTTGGVLQVASMDGNKSVPLYTRIEWTI